MDINLLPDEGLEIRGEIYVKGVGTYDGSNPISGTNDIASVIGVDIITNEEIDEIWYNVMN